MTLCDAGPMVALVNRKDPNHLRCASAVRAMPAEALVTTWPCIAEAMHLLGRAGGYPAQEKLWAFFTRGTVVPHIPAAAETERIRLLMSEYRDTPMDLADASLVSAAERLAVTRVFTLDHHFHAYRSTVGHFDLVPL